MAIYWPTPGYKGRTFKFCSTRWDFNFYVRSSPLRGYFGECWGFCFDQLYMHLSLLYYKAALLTWFLCVFCCCSFWFFFFFFLFSEIKFDIFKFRPGVTGTADGCSIRSHKLIPCKVDAGLSGRILWVRVHVCWRVSACVFVRQSVSSCVCTCVSNSKPRFPEQGVR